MNALDLYAKIEPLIGFYEEYEELYEEYISLIKTLHVEKILDIGCGNGKFLQLLQRENYQAIGIDRSREMVRISTSLGVDARNMELGELKTSFDCATAIGDVLNYMTQKELIVFFKEVSKILEKDAYFIADINTQNGFQEVADGLLIKENSEQFLAIEADFDGQVLQTNMTLFEKNRELYKKYSNKILQFYHPVELFEKFDGFTLVKKIDISMFGDLDKTALVFKKV